MGHERCIFSVARFEESYQKGTMQGQFGVMTKLWSNSEQLLFSLPFSKYLKNESACNVNQLILIGLKKNKRENCYFTPSNSLIV